MSDATPVLPADVTQPTGFLHTLLTMSLTAVAVLRPLYAEDGETIRDFAWVSLNPAGQRMLGQPECPAGSLLTVFPAAQANEGFARYCQAFVTGETQHQQTNYQADGIDGYFVTVAQRYENVLIVNFSDTIAIDVSAHLLARQQVQVLNEELAAVNEELRASNEEYQQANTELSDTQQQVQQLNQELEARVQVRTQEALALQADLLLAVQAQVLARETFYQTFEQTPALVAILRGPEHRYEYLNPAYQRQFAGRELMGRPMAAALPETVAQGFVALFDTVYQTGETYFGRELPLTLEATGDAPAQVDYFNFSCQAYRENGQTVGVSVFAYNVTEQVLARHEREGQQHLVETVFAQAPVGVWVTQGPDYVFELVNPRMSLLMGFPADQMVGRPYFEVMAEFVDQGVPPLFQRAWEQGEPIYLHEFAVKMPYDAPGEVSYFSLVIQPLRDETGQISRLVCVSTEVTDQIRARQQVQKLNEELAVINEELTATNEELNESNTQLTRTNVDLDTFVYTASHDLKAPITNIESITLALRDTLPADVQQDEMIAHLLDLLEHTTTRFQVTIGQLTDLSKLQLAHAGPAESVRLAAVIESVRLDLAPVIAGANAHLTVEVAPDLLVSFSPANLRSAIYNLLSNAVKYRALDRPAQVQVRAFLVESRVVLEVQDNGLGMSAVQQRQLFGLFQRLHTHVEGTGVGLYITKRLVENGGGTIAVASQVDVGTTFTLTFPA